MPLQLTEAPEDSRQALAAGLARFAEASRQIGGTLVIGGPSFPHKVYVLELGDVERGLSSARHVSWRYLLGNPGKAEEAAEVSVGDGRVPSFRGVQRGPFVRALQEAIPRAQRRAAASDYAYELRLLQVPALRVVALWLAARARDADRLMPLPPAPAAFAAEELSEDEFVQRLRDLAKRVGSFDDAPQDGASKAR